MLPTVRIRIFGPKTFDFSSKKRIFCPKTTKFGPKLAFLDNLGQAMQAYSVPCWWVGWWLWRGLYLARHLFTLFFISSKPIIAMHYHSCTIAEKCLFVIIKKKKREKMQLRHRMCVVIYIFTVSKLLRTTSICALVIYAFSRKNNPCSNNHILCTCSSAECVLMWTLRGPAREDA